MSNYTQEQLDFLRHNRATPRAALTALFNARFGTDKSDKAIISICKKKGWFTGRTGCFSKGHKSWNTGTKGICKANSGCFQKGHLPKNWKPVGSERVDVDGYVLVKVAEPNVWQLKSVVVWETAHGKIKKGHVIRYKDDNRLNCSIENLDVIRRPVHLYLNQHGYSEMPEELKPSLKMIAEVEVKVFERQRKGCTKVRCIKHPTERNK